MITGRRSRAASLDFLRQLPARALDRAIRGKMSLPSETFHLGDVEAHLGHVAFPSALAAGVRHAYVAQAERRDDVAGDVVDGCGALAAEVEVVDFVAGVLPSEDDSVDAFADVEVGLGLLPVAKHFELARIFSQLPNEIDDGAVSPV